MQEAVFSQHAYFVNLCMPGLERYSVFSANLVARLSSSGFGFRTQCEDAFMQEAGSDLVGCVIE